MNHTPLDTLGRFVVRLGIEAELLKYPAPQFGVTDITTMMQLAIDGIGTTACEEVQRDVHLDLGLAMEDA